MCWKRPAGQWRCCTSSFIRYNSYITRIFYLCMYLLAIIQGEVKTLKTVSKKVVCFICVKNMCKICRKNGISWSCVFSRKGCCVKIEERYCRKIEEFCLKPTICQIEYHVLYCVFLKSKHASVPCKYHWLKNRAQALVF